MKSLNCRGFINGPVFSKCELYLHVIFCVCGVDAGMGAVDVAILDPEGHRDATRPTITQKSEGVWLVEYTPAAPGLHSVNVFFAGKAIPGSPFGVGIAPGNKLMLSAVSRCGISVLC